MRLRRAIQLGSFSALWCALAIPLHAGQPAPETPSEPETPCDKTGVPLPPPATIPAETPRNDRLDPVEVLQQVVDRYHRLLTYRDRVLMTQVTRRAGDEATSTETHMNCEIAGGRLTVDTAGSRLRQSLGLEIPAAAGGALDKARRRYDLWLAPHMIMRFAERPLSEFRAGVDEGFTATEAESVIVENRTMVHLELKSGDGRSEDCAATFDLFINPDSMLIERIEGEQRMPDGANCQTTLSITPTLVELSSDAEPSRPTM